MTKTVNDLQTGFDLTYETRKHGKNSSVSSHIHNYHEIYYLIKGNARYFINNEFIDLEQGDIILVKKGLIHKTLYDLKNPCERLLICFDDKFIDKNEKLSADLVQNIKISLFSPTIHHKSENLILEMKQEFESDELMKTDMCKHMLTELLILFLRNTGTANRKKLSGNEKTIQNASKFISDNCHENLSLGNISKRYAMSECYFSRLFKKYTGFGVTEYINEIRISHAEELLKNTNLKITDISSMCGFNDSNYFSSVFKKKKGVSPHIFSNIYKNRKRNDKNV